MTWKSEAREIKQKKYSGYCEMCKTLNIIPVPYHSFTLELYSEVKQQYKTESAYFANYINTELNFVNTMRVEKSSHNKNKRVYYCNTNNILPVLGRCTAEQAASGCKIIF